MLPRRLTDKDPVGVEVPELASEDAPDGVESPRDRYAESRSDEVELTDDLRSNRLIRSFWVADARRTTGRTPIEVSGILQTTF